MINNFRRRAVTAQLTAGLSFTDYLQKPRHDILHFQQCAASSPRNIVSAAKYFVSAIALYWQLIEIPIAVNKCFDLAFAEIFPGQD